MDEKALTALKFLGCFTPTVNVRDRLVKGTMIGEDGEVGRTYLSADDLRLLGEGLITAADALDARAAQD